MRQAMRNKPSWHTIQQWNKVVVPNSNIYGGPQWPEHRVRQMLVDSGDTRWAEYAETEWLHIIEDRERQWGERKVVKNHIFYIADDSLSIMSRLIA